MKNSDLTSDNFPQEEYDLIKRVLSLDQETIHTQIATIDGDQPKVRTVGLALLDQYCTIGFDTHIESPKWKQLTTSSAIAGCHFSLRFSIQLRFEGRARLISQDGANDLDLKMLDERWRMMSKHIRSEIWRDYNQENAPDDINTRCPTSGLVLVYPSVWDLYWFDPTDLSKEWRRVYKKSNHGWQGRSQITVK